VKQYSIDILTEAGAMLVLSQHFGHVKQSPAVAKDVGMYSAIALSAEDRKQFAFFYFSSEDSVTKS